MGFNQDYCALDAFYDHKTGDGYVGIDVKKAKASRTTQNHAALAELVTPPKKSCCWFGYLDDGTPCCELAVWFYCGDRKTAEKIRDRLRRQKMPVAECKREETAKPEWWNVVVRTREPHTASDRDWFVSVFDAAGIKPVM